jgi:GGDEF domain-containing protein
MKTIPLKEALALLDSCPLAMLLLESDGSIRGFNRAFAALTGESTGILTDASQPEGLLAPLLGQGTLINWIMPDGDERWLAVETVELEGAAGVIARFYLDITEKLRLKKERDTLEHELREQALKDSLLTSLLSRHGMSVSLAPLVARSRRYNSPLSVVTVGIQTDQDRTKALTRFAYMLNDQTRWADLVGVNDNHDFILILQETTRDSALRLVEKLAEQIASMNASSGTPLDARYGITQCQMNDDVESILVRAEAALAEARQNDSGTSIAV